jgi:hypothetical protein
VVKETGSYPPELEKKYQVLSQKYDRAMRDMLDSINKVDFYNSGLAPPSIMEIMKSFGDLFGGVTGIGSLYGDLQVFKGEVAKLKAAGGRMVKRNF